MLFSKSFLQFYLFCASCCVVKQTTDLFECQSFFWLVKFCLFGSRKIFPESQLFPDSKTFRNTSLSGKAGVGFVYGCHKYYEK